MKCIAAYFFIVFVPAKLHRIIQARPLFLTTKVFHDVIQFDF